MNLVCDTIFREQHDFQFGRMDSAQQHIIFHSSFLPPHHQNTITIDEKKQTICIAFRFIPFIIFVRHYKSLDLRSHYRITTTAIATTTMKMDHFVKSLLLNMIVVWHFPPSFIKILVISVLFHLNLLSMLQLQFGLNSSRLRLSIESMLCSFQAIKSKA